jgi:hypothetical protein
VAIKISRVEQKTASLIAASVLAAGVDKEVPDAKGYYAYWLAEQTPHGRALIDCFHAEYKKIASGLADGMANELKKENRGPLAQKAP